MSDRFTEKAENALNRSVKSAELLGHTYIGTEHILLALAEDELCCAALILKKNGIDKAVPGAPSCHDCECEHDHHHHNQDDED